VARPVTDQEMEDLLQQARETLGSGLAALETRAIAGPPEAAVAEEEARLPADLVVAGRPARDGAELAERLLASGTHNLLLAPGPPSDATALERLLICVAIGEPGKADVSFAGRLARHLGAVATILTVLPESERGAAAGAERFLASCARTLTRQGVAVTTRTRFGAPREQILLERAEGNHDLLVVGAPLPGAGGRIALGGMMARLLRESAVPVLVVRSPEATA
jgi:nucleotide-binding universal stress UspA family protein